MSTVDRIVAAGKESVRRGKPHIIASGDKWIAVQGRLLLGEYFAAPAIYMGMTPLLAFWRLRSKIALDETRERLRTIPMRGMS